MVDSDLGADVQGQVGRMPRRAQNAAALKRNRHQIIRTVGHPCRAADDVQTGFRESRLVLVQAAVPARQLIGHAVGHGEVQRRQVPPPAATAQPVDRRADDRVEKLVVHDFVVQRHHVAQDALLVSRRGLSDDQADEREFSEEPDPRPADLSPARLWQQALPRLALPSARTGRPAAVQAIEIQVRKEAKGCATHALRS